MRCPDCGTDNLQGADSCEQCGQPLTGLNQPDTATESLVLNTAISDLPMKSPLAVSEDVTVSAAVQTMADSNIGCLLVTRDSNLTGIITERDVLQITSDPGNLEQPVSAFMTPQPESCCTSDSLAYVVGMMSAGGYRHLPVLNDGIPVGLLSTRDILKFLATQFPD